MSGQDRGAVGQPSMDGSFNGRFDPTDTAGQVALKEACYGASSVSLSLYASAATLFAFTAYIESIAYDTPSNNVRGVRNIPCVDVPGKRAATPKDCRSDKPYIPIGTNPWYGDPNQIRNCPALGARCDQPVEPGHVIPAPSTNTFPCRSPRTSTCSCRT